MTNFSQYLRQLTQSMTKDDYVIVVDDFDNFKLVLKGDGRIAGNYHLSHLSTVDDIDQQKSTELDECNENVDEMRTVIVDKNSISFALDDDDMDDAEIQPIEYIDEHSFLELGHHYSDIFQKLQDKTMSFDELFDLLSGLGRRGRHISVQDEANDKIVLTKDVDVSVLSFENGKYLWRTETLGKAGDVVEGKNSYAYMEHDGKRYAYHLNNQEKINTLSAGSLKDKDAKKDPSSPKNGLTF